MLSARRVLGLSVLAIALIGCGGAPPATADLFAKASPIPTPLGVLVQFGGVTYTNWGERNAHGENTRKLDAGDFYFSGTFLRGNRGQRLILEIQNVAEQFHNFSLPAQGLDQDIPPRTVRVNVAVTFPQSGGVQFFCKYHTAQGMNGLLLVGGVPLQSATIPKPQPPSR
jgi:plastocyanin